MDKYHVIYQNKYEKDIIAIQEFFDETEVCEFIQNELKNNNSDLNDYTVILGHSLDIKPTIKLGNYNE